MCIVGKDQPGRVHLTYPKCIKVRLRCLHPSKYSSIVAIHTKCLATFVSSCLGLYCLSYHGAAETHDSVKHPALDQFESFHRVQKRVPKVVSVRCAVWRCKSLVKGVLRYTDAIFKQRNSMKKLPHSFPRSPLFTSGQASQTRGGNDDHLSETATSAVNSGSNLNLQSRMCSG